MVLKTPKNLIYFFAFLSFNIGWSQLRNQTISSIGGTNKTNSNIVVTHSVGQVGIVGKVLMNNKNIIQGFQQPFWGKIISKQNSPEFKVKIFPVPFDKDITIQYPNAKEMNVFIFDITGKVIYNSTLLFKEANQKINLEKLSAGVYLVKVQSKELSYFTKIIKN